MNNQKAMKYKNLMEEVVGDVFYSNVSYRGKIAIIRQLAEVFVRVIIDFPDGKYFTLGEKKYVEPLIRNVDMINNTGSFLFDVTEELRNIGNIKTHTGDTNRTEEKEYTDTLEILYKLMAYPFIDYFCKMGNFSDEADVGLFSILPPNIRFITLKKLSEIYPENIFIWHKLALAILKNESIENALDWVETNKQFFEEMQTKHSKFDFSEYYNKGNLPNMYLHLIEALKHVKNERDLKKFPIYETFEESAREYEKLNITNNGKLLIRFAPDMKSLLDFLFQGH